MPNIDRAVETALVPTSPSASALGSEPIPMTPAEFAAFIEVEIEKWLKVAAASNFKLN